MVLDDSLRILKQFAIHEVDYVLVGGVALNVHGIARATEDMDVFVDPRVENVVRLRQALKSLYNDSDIDEIRAEDLSGAYPTIRYTPPSGALYLDILSRLGSFAAFEDLAAEEKEWRGVTVRVATPATLYWLKKDTVRMIDKADTEALKRKFDL